MKKVQMKTKYLIKKFISFRKNTEGLAAIEFALILPLLIATYIGTVEVSRAYIIKNKIETVSETITDLITQGQQTSRSDLRDIFNIAAKSLSPEERSKYNIVVTSIETQPDSNGNPVSRVTWSRSRKGGKTHAKDTRINDLPDGIARNYETIIMTELYYKHRAIIGFFVKGRNSFDRRYFSKPRYTNAIPCPDC